jgi:glycosyltransferase involved in cell wall biosynthesis
LKIYMLVLNTFTHDTRIIKEANTLIESGHVVEVFALAEKGLPLYEVRKDGIVVHRIQKAFFLRFRSPVRTIFQNLKKATSKVEAQVRRVVHSIMLRVKKPSSIILLVPFILPFAVILWIFVVILKTANLLFKRLFEIFVYVKVYLWFIRSVTGSRADVYHAHDLNTLLPAVVMAHRTGGSVIYDSHEYFLERNVQRSFFWQKIWSIMESSLIKRVNAVITVSDSIADALSLRYQIKKPTVVRNVQPYMPYRTSESLNQLPELQDHGCIAIYAGRITSGRGLENLIEASHFLDRVTIVIMGRGSTAYVSAISKKISQESLNQSVILLPAVEPELVHEYLCSANIGLMPTENICLSYYLGAGNKLFHYLMAGLPVVVADHPEKRRIVNQFDVGFVVDENNPKEIASAIQTLVDDNEMRSRFSMNGLEAAKVLNWKNEQKKLLALYIDMKNQYRSLYG